MPITVTDQNSKEILSQFAQASIDRGPRSIDSKALVIREQGIERRGSSFLWGVITGRRDAVVDDKQKTDNISLRNALYNAIATEYGSDAAAQVREMLVGGQKLVRGENLGAKEVRLAFERAKLASGGKKPLLESLESLKDDDWSIEWNKPQSETRNKTMEAAKKLVADKSLSSDLKELLTPIIFPECFDEDTDIVNKQVNLFKEIKAVARAYPHLAEKDAFIKGAENYAEKKLFSELRNGLPPEKTVLKQSSICLDLPAHPGGSYPEKTLNIPRAMFYRAGIEERKILSEDLQCDINNKTKDKDGKHSKIEDYENDKRVEQWKNDLNRSGSVNVAGKTVKGTNLGPVGEPAKQVGKYIAELYPGEQYKADATIRDLAQILHQGTAGAFIMQLSNFRALGGRGTRPWLTPLPGVGKNISIKKEADSDPLIIEMKVDVAVSNINYKSDFTFELLTKGEGNPDPSARAAVKTNFNIKLKYTPPTDHTQPGRIEVVDVFQELQASILSSS